MFEASVLLLTGRPGSGKTLSAVADLAAMLEDWGKHPEKKRQVFTHGVRDLALDHSLLPIYPREVPERGPDGSPIVERVRGRDVAVMRPGEPGDPVEWDELDQPLDQCDVDWESVPDGSVVIIDEAHKLFPKTTIGARVSPSVAFFATVRHHDVLVYLLTQDPMSIDVEVRRRVGLHRHYVRSLMSRSMVFEWPECSPSLQKSSAIQKKIWKWPRAAFRLYTTANAVSGGARMSFPWWLYVLAFVVVVGIGGAIWGFLRYRDARAAAAAVPAPVAAPVTVVTAPPVPPVSASAARSASAPGDDVEVAGCMHFGARCQCIDSRGYLLKWPRHRCEDAARTAGVDIPYPSGRVDPPALSASWSASAPDGSLLPHPSVPPVGGAGVAAVPPPDWAGDSPRHHVQRPRSPL